MNSEYILHFQSSQLSCFYECPRKWYYNYFLRRCTPPSDPMMRGSAFHKLAEYYYGLNIPLSELKEHLAQDDPQYMKYFNEVFPVFLCYVEEEKSSGYEIITIEGKPAVELEFELKLADWFFYRGKLDSLRTRANTDKLYIVDWKVTGAYLNDYFFKKFEMSPQNLSYTFVAQEHLKNVAGFVIDAVMIRNPKFAFVKKFFPLSPNLDEFIAELYRLGEFIKHNIHDENAFEHRYTSCITKYNKNCPYTDVCLSSASMRHKILYSDLYIDYETIYEETV